MLDRANHPIIDSIWHRISEGMRTRTMNEWIAEFDRLGVPASQVLLAGELAADEHVIAAGMMLEVEHELVGRESCVGPLVEMSGIPNWLDPALTTARSPQRGCPARVWCRVR